jgi:predicted unusual protein kinase regulating ubiquinone biosynthesis (AarF/ABC1/UbiB family)
MADSSIRDTSPPKGWARGQLSWRYVRVLSYFGILTLNVLFWDIFLRNVGLGSLSRRTADRRYGRWAGRFRRLATQLGGIWIKVGQFLSARVDVLPPSITDELAGLQDEVPAEGFDDLMMVVEQEFGDEVEKQFEWFDPEPLASASLGQVHRSRLPGGERVVIKIQRPGIEGVIATDLRALHVVTGWLERFKPISRRADLEALFEEFSRTVWEEVDYVAEAENARRFATMFAGDEDIRVPAVFEAQTTRRVLTLEDVYFIKITDYAAIDRAGVDRAEVAERLFRTYLYQIFEVGFFHADPHPGNLFVEPLEEGKWRLVFVDFGMVGRLPSSTKEGLRDLAVAVATRDADRLLSAYQKLNVLLPGADLDRIRQAETAMFDRYWGMSMRELTSIDVRDMHEFAKEYRDLLYELPFQMPTNLIFLGRCVAILSGMCTGINPEFNLFEGLMPFAERLVREEGGEIVKEVLEWLERQARLLLRLPGRMDAFLGLVERGELVVTARPTPDLERQIIGLNRALGQLVAAIIFLALLLTGAILYLGGEQYLGVIFLGVAILSLWWVIRR